MKEVSELIRGEIAAVKSIDSVLNKLKDDIERNELTSIRQDHVRAADTLKRFAGKDAGEVSESGGPWAAFTSAFTGSASFFGDKAALRALKAGEEHGLREYKEALNEDGVDESLKNVIRSELLPMQERHLAMINKYIQ